MVVDLAALVVMAAEPAVPAISVAFFGFAGTVVLALVTLLVAIITNRSEKQKVADATVEAVLRERILMKDEKIREQDDDIEDLKSKIQRLEEDHARYRLAVEETRAEERALLDERGAAADS